jgi:isoleucyl-tRNA synthetase
LGILAEARVEALKTLLGIESVVATVRGEELQALHYAHPMDSKVCPVVTAEYVSMVDGTGCVHTAPGHGKEDFETGRKFNLPVVCPVDDRGLFTAQAAPYTGQLVFKANPLIQADLRNKGLLLREETITHKYPCCWRCKKPVIFRATEQWFVAVDAADGRKRALEAVRSTRWIPEWGSVRISSMLQERPDWCISRQRAWGVPIPAFYCQSCGQVKVSPEIVRRARDRVALKGSDEWFSTGSEEWLPPGIRCEKCAGTSFRKETDIFDVWFESACSHRAVSMRHPDLHFPADLYLEGTDQHRGWFQVSLLASLFSW